MKVLFLIITIFFVYNLMQVIVLTFKKRKLEQEMQESRKEILEKWEVYKKTMR